MTKFNYIYFKKDKKLRILNSKFNSKLTVVFLHGLKSDMEGKKPLFLNRYCKKTKLTFYLLNMLVMASHMENLKMELFLNGGTTLNL